MALGYEGLIKVGNYYALGTGSSVPRSRTRLESSAGYGGKITAPTPQMGIGLPYNYDWSEYGGSLNFEVDSAFFANVVKDWVISNRQTAKTMLIQPRGGAAQSFSTAYWNSINISASEGAAVDGSIAFVALERDSYVWGNNYRRRKTDITDNKTGNGLLCPLDPYMPAPLNKDITNRAPVPFWNTKIMIGSPSPYMKNFTTWTVEFTQDVVKFFGCGRTSAGPDPSAQEPLYLAVGPMTATFSGSYMENFDGTSNAFLGDSLNQVVVYVANESITLKRLEATTESDDVQTGGTLVPLSVEYAVYEIAAA